MPDQFDGDFYVMAATVIPVFYLALTFQSTVSKDMITRMQREGSPFTQFVNLEAAIILFGVLFIAEALGEGYAIYALWAKDGDSFYRNYIFGSLLALVITAVIGPISPFVVALAKLGFRRKPSNPQPANQTSPTDEETLDS
jgi:hypothetical protein